MISKIKRWITCEGETADEIQQKIDTNIRIIGVLLLVVLLCLCVRTAVFLDWI